MTRWIPTKKEKYGVGKSSGSALRARLLAEWNSLKVGKHCVVVVGGVGACRVRHTNTPARGGGSGTFAVLWMSRCGAAWSWSWSWSWVGAGCSLVAVNDLCNCLRISGEQPRVQWAYQPFCCLIWPSGLVGSSQGDFTGSWLCWRVPWSPPSWRGPPVGPHMEPELSTCQIRGQDLSVCQSPAERTESPRDQQALWGPWDSTGL